MSFTMKFVAIAALVAVAVAAPTGNEPTTPVVEILKQSQEGPHPDGSYAFDFEAANGIKFQEQGVQVPAANPEAEYKTANSVQGSFQYPDAEGNVYTVTYTADENGFQPQGAHLPVGPDVPEHIVRALQYIADHPEEDNLH